jgi:cell division protein FtsA
MAKEVLVGLDVGTTKICVIVGEVSDDHRIDIIGVGTHPSYGLKKGMVVNIESTVESIRKAVEEAELMAGVRIDAVCTGIAGGHIKGFNSRGVIAVKTHEVTRADIARAIDTAKAVAIPDDRETLHVIPQEFIVDAQDGIKDPLGMSGVRLEAEVHIITGAVTAAQNIEKSIHRAGLKMLDMVLQPLASSEAVLTSEEKEMGVAMIDIGGGTTDLAIFVEGSVRHSAVMAIGGSHFTNDIAIGLRTPPAEAEKIKLKHGCADSEKVRETEMLEVPGVGGRPSRTLSRQTLCEIIQPRAEEIFALVAQEIEKMGYQERIASGTVITGGAATLPGMVEVAERMIGVPARIGRPTGVGGLIDVVNNPMYATGVGLILHAVRNRDKTETRQANRGQMWAHIRSRMQAWAREFF